MINELKLGVAGGILWSASMAVCTILALYTGYSEQFLNLIASIYWGFDISWSGVFIGAIYGFFDAFIGLYLLSWLYNRLPL
jgi:hypothetical protein